MDTEGQESPEFILTRYLYIHKYVAISLISALLEKNIDKALFWAFEIFYSGDHCELLHLCWIIYYGFYAALNPSFDIYLLEIQDKFLNSDDLDDKAKILSLIIANFNNLHYSLDIYILSKIYGENQYYVPDLDFNKSLDERNFEDITKYIMNINTNEELMQTFQKSITYFNKKNKNKELEHFKEIIQKSYVKPQIILLSVVFSHYNKKLKVKMGKNLIIDSFDYDIDQFKNIYVNESLPAYKILPMAYKYDSFYNENMIQLFDDERNNSSKKDELYYIYNYNWLYYASFSPLWLQRIQKYNGTINHKTKKVEFSDESMYQEFYLNFGYEPDEQTRETQNKSIGIDHIHDENMNWKSIYQKYGSYGLLKSYLLEK